MSSVVQNNPDFFNGLSETAKKLLLPALVGAAGTGAATGYVSSKEHRPDENPAMRRRRIMRNALLGSALGGTAIMGVPLGLKSVMSPMNGGSKPSLPSRAVDGAVDTISGNALPAGAAALGGWKWHKHLQSAKGNAEGKLLQLLKGEFKSPEHIRAALGDPTRKHQILNHLATAMGGSGENGGLFRANELLQEAGHTGSNVAEMAAGRAGADSFPAQYRTWLGEQGPLASLASKSRIAEGYGRFVRPSAGKLVGRVNPLAALGLIGGGALAARQLQNKLTGN